MAEIINLRQARKAREREAAEAQAERNRAKFGLGKAERKKREANDKLAIERHESHRLKPTDET
jgi:seryl-tRNA synthetase